MSNVILEQFRLAIRRDHDAIRPHEREIMLTRDNASEVRAMVMLTFPIVVALMWPSVALDAQTGFVIAVALVLVCNALGWVVPWRRLPRWTESMPPLVAVACIWFMAASTGGSANGFAIILVVPITWLTLYGDPADIACGLAIAALLALAPTQDWVDRLPHQGTLAQRAGLVLVLITLVLGMRPIVSALREQVRTSRRATYSLRASQAALAHDLRTPLTSMCALATLTEQRLDAEAGPGPVDLDAVRDYARRIAMLGWRAESIICGVLDLSQAAEQLPSVERIDIARLVREIATSIDGVTIELGAIPTHVTGHGPSIRRLFANLLENAATHGVGSGDGVARVEVHGDEHAGGWWFVVRDHGPGITPGDIDSVFQPWQRGTDARDGGYGLGLAIVAAIVEQHGGSIAVDQAAPSGARFTFTLARAHRLVTSEDELITRAATSVPLA